MAIGKQYLWDAPGKKRLDYEAGKKPSGFLSLF